MSLQVVVFHVLFSTGIKNVNQKYELHYCSAFIEVRSGGTIGAYAITTNRYNEFHSQKLKSLYIRTTKCPNRNKNLDY